MKKVQIRAHLLFYESAFIYVLLVSKLKLFIEVQWIAVSRLGELFASLPLIAQEITTN